MHSRFEFVLERGTKGRLAIIMAKRDDFEQEMAQKVLSTGSSLLMAINRSNALIRRSEGRCLHLSRGRNSDLWDAGEQHRKCVETKGMSTAG
jgi:hypothetical protein